MPSAAIAETHAALQAQARTTAVALIKSAARRYASYPRDLDSVALGLSGMKGEGMVAALQNTRIHPARWLGFGGEARFINYRAAMLFARCARAKERTSLAIRPQLRGAELFSQIRKDVDAIFTARGDVLYLDLTNLGYTPGQLLAYRESGGSVVFGAASDHAIIREYHKDEYRRAIGRVRPGQW